MAKIESIEISKMNLKGKVPDKKAIEIEDINLNLNLYKTAKYFKEPKMRFNKETIRIIEPCSYMGNT